MALDFSTTIGRYISLTWRLMSANMGKKLAPYGIGPGQFPVLFILYGEDGLSQRAIAERIALDKAAVARAVDKLERLEYVRRKPDGGDKRVINVFLTPKAIKLRPKLEEAVESLLDEMQTGLDPHERKVAKKLLGVMVANLNAARKTP